MAEADEEPDTELLILDRSFDVVAPLIHEYTYEAVVFNTLDGAGLDVETGIFEFNENSGGATSTQPTDRAFVLSPESDDLFGRLRLTHIFDAQAEINRETGKLREQFSSLIRVEKGDAVLI